MGNFITLNCPSCGAKLQIGNTLHQFACGFCGNEHIINRVGGTVSISPVNQNLEKIANESRKTSSELAIRRLEYEIPEMEKKIIKEFEKEVKKYGMMG